uniref:Facilitated trehalose transporter Tret1 n=2 Tax=Lygus hesperus TaxID=30085 RepID=A0A146LHJ7_LYGHE
MMFYLGALYVSCISYSSYQTMTLLCGVPALLLFITFMFIPESPYYYLMHGKRKEAEDAVVWLRGHCDKEEFKRIEDGVQEQLQNKGTFKEIFSFKPNRNAFIMIELFKVFSSCTACLILFSYSTTLVKDSFVSSQDSYILLCILWVFAALVSSSIMDKFPRRKILGVSCVGTLSFYAITTIWYYLKEFSTVDLSSTTWVPLVSIMFGSFFEIIGIVNIPNVLKGEIFPINIKTKAIALSCMTACGLETVNALFYYDLNYLIGEYINFLKPCISCCLCLYITIFHMFETKGLDLETIQHMLTGKNRGKNVENEKHGHA